MTHLSPPSKLRFILGATPGHAAVNGLFFHVEFQYDDNAFVGTEAGVRAIFDSFGNKPAGVMDLVNYVPARPPRIFNETNPIQVEVGDFSRWGAVKFHEWDGTYDYAWQWATYGWAKIEGTLAPFQEFFRVTINKDPVADLDHLGDRSLVAFINSDHGKQYIYFSCYHYGYLEEVDSTNTFHKVEVTGRLTTWFYTYFQVSVTHRKA